MKKNVFMRAALLLLVLTLITSCFVGGTFAKYITIGDPTADTARVAKWGVEITANGSTFADEYNTHNEDVMATIAKSVVTAGAAGDAVVAPGTNGTMAVMTISGTPEVAVNVSYAATLTLTGWTVGGNDYCPIEITVGDVTYTTVRETSGTAVVKCTSNDDLKAKVEAAIAAYSKNYAAKTNLATAAAPTISWAWAFVGDDVKDTALGDAATAATITLSIVTTVTQID